MLRTRLVAGVTSGVVLSAVFATALTVVCFAEAFFPPWRVDPALPAPVTLHMPRTAVRIHDQDDGEIRLASVSSSVARGHMVDDPTLASLVRAYEDGRRPPRVTHLLAQWIVYFVLVMLATTYLRRFSAKAGALLHTQVAMLALTIGFLVLAKGLLLFTALPVYIFPVALVPLWASLYVDRRTGAIMSLLMSLFMSSLVAYDPIASVVYVFSSGAAALSVRPRRPSIFLVVSGVLSGVVGAGVYVSSKEIFDGFDLDDEFSMSGSRVRLQRWQQASWLASPPSSCSRSRTLVRHRVARPTLAPHRPRAAAAEKMAREAPGRGSTRARWRTWRKPPPPRSAPTRCSRASAPTITTSARPVRPSTSSRTSSRGELSPHEDLDPDVSADAIMAHVVEGVRILREGDIPEPVVEFSYTHHGTASSSTSGTSAWPKGIRRASARTSSAIRACGRARRRRPS